MSVRHLRGAPGGGGDQGDRRLEHGRDRDPGRAHPGPAEASYASELDPLSGAGPLASSDIALAQGLDSLARDYLIEAVRRQPTDAPAWRALIRVDLDLGRDGEVVRAAQRVLELDPAMGTADRAALGDDVVAAQVAAAPPTRSATARVTPAG